MKKTAFLVISLVLLSLTACTTPAPTGPMSTWQVILSKCSGSDLFKPAEYVYFGPSNTIAPGSIWRLAADDTYGLRWDADDIRAASGHGVPVRQGVWGTCGSVSTIGHNIDASIVLRPGLRALSVSANTLLSKTTVVSAGLDAWRLDILKEGPYDALLQRTPDLKHELASKDRLVMIKAVRIKGFHMNLRIDEKNRGEIKVDSTTPKFELSPGISAQWTDDSHLVVRTTDEAYVAGALSQYAAGPLGALLGSPTFEQIIPNPDARLIRENK